MKTIQDVFSTGLMDVGYTCIRGSFGLENGPSTFVLCHLNFEVALHNPNEHLEVIDSGHPKDITCYPSS